MRTRSISMLLLLSGLLQACSEGAPTQRVHQQNTPIQQVALKRVADCDSLKQKRIDNRVVALVSPRTDVPPASLSVSVAPSIPWQQKTDLVLIDVSNPVAPVISKRIRLDGSLLLPSPKTFTRSTFNLAGCCRRGLTPWTASKRCRIMAKC